MYKEIFSPRTRKLRVPRPTQKSWSILPTRSWLLPVILYTTRSYWSQSRKPTGPEAEWRCRKMTHFPPVLGLCILLPIVLGISVKSLPHAIGSCGTEIPGVDEAETTSLWQGLGPRSLKVKGHSLTSQHCLGSVSYYQIISRRFPRSSTKGRRLRGGEAVASVQHLFSDWEGEGPGGQEEGGHLPPIPAPGWVWLSEWRGHSSEDTSLLWGDRRKRKLCRQKGHCLSEAAGWSLGQASPPRGEVQTTSMDPRWRTTIKNK